MQLYTTPWFEQLYLRGYSRIEIQEMISLGLTTGMSKTSTLFSATGINRLLYWVYTPQGHQYWSDKDNLSNTYQCSILELHKGSLSHD